VFQQLFHPCVSSYEKALLQHCIYSAVYQRKFQLCFCTEFQNLCSSICVPAVVFQHLCFSSVSALCSSSVTALCFSFCSSSVSALCSSICVPASVFQHLCSSSVSALCFIICVPASVFQQLCFSICVSALFQHCVPALLQHCVSASVPALGTWLSLLANQPNYSCLQARIS
jgi:hypothetical protein